MKKIFSLFLILVTFFACKPTETKENETIKLTVEEFGTKAPSMIGKKISITGTIVHICQHGGKRAHIIGNDENIKVKLETTPNVNKFSKEMEGSTVAAEGIVKAEIIDDTYLNKWENDIKNAGSSDKNLHDGHSKESEGMTESEENLAKIKNYRDELKNTGKNKLEFYWVDLSKYEIKK